MAQVHMLQETAKSPLQVSRCNAELKHGDPKMRGSASDQGSYSRIDPLGRARESTVQGMTSSIKRARLCALTLPNASLILNLHTAPDVLAHS